jgi:ComF family protein
MQFGRLLNDFFKLFIPSKCLNCGINLHDYEQHVCKSCLVKIAKTNFLNNKENPISQAFWGRSKLEHAFSFYYFTKGSILQNLIHEIKYHGGKELAQVLGKEFGFGIKQSDQFYKFDLICPVPLHVQKEKRRGYNQSDWIAKGMAEVLSIPVSTNILQRKVFTSTQTKKNRQQRWENVKDAFVIGDYREAENKHILLVDDVMTTGATLEACAQKLLDIQGTKVSIAALAYAFDI